MWYSPSSHSPRKIFVRDLLEWVWAGGMVRAPHVAGVSDYHAGMVAAVELLESEASSSQGLDTGAEILALFAGQGCVRPTTIRTTKW